MLSVVIPVYGNRDSLIELIRELEEVSVQLPEGLEAVFVVDGSPDDSFAILKKALPQSKLEAQLHLLSRNFGSFSAIRAGFEKARGEFVAVMAADLQEPTTLLLDFDRLLRSGEGEVVLGVRSERNDPWSSKIASKFFWKLYKKFVQEDMPQNGVDIFACNRAFLKELIALRESNSSLVGLTIWLGFKRVELPYIRKVRPYGKSAWTLKKKFRYLNDSIYNFSDLPFRLLLSGGTVGLVISICLSIIVLSMRLMGWIQVPGYSILALLIMGFGAINCMAFGVLGGYLWRTFENSKGRPNFVVAASYEWQSQ